MRVRISIKKVDSIWNVMVHGDAREGKWRWNWRMELVASILHATSEHGVSSITNADSHTSAAGSRLNWLPRRFKWTVRFTERRNLVSARVPSHFNWPLTRLICKYNPVGYSVCFLSFFVPAGNSCSQSKAGCRMLIILGLKQPDHESNYLSLSSDNV